MTLYTLFLGNLMAFAFFNRCESTVTLQTSSVQHDCGGTAILSCLVDPLADVTWRESSTVLRDCFTDGTCDFPDSSPYSFNLNSSAKTYQLAISPLSYSSFNNVIFTCTASSERGTYTLQVDVPLKNVTLSESQAGSIVQLVATTSCVKDSATINFSWTCVRFDNRNYIDCGTYLTNTSDSVNNTPCSSGGDCSGSDITQKIQTLTFSNYTSGGGIPVLLVVSIQGNTNINATSTATYYIQSSTTTAEPTTSAAPTTTSTTSATSTTTSATTTTSTAAGTTTTTSSVTTSQTTVTSSITTTDKTANDNEIVLIVVCSSIGGIFVISVVACVLWNFMRGKSKCYPSKKKLKHTNSHHIGPSHKHVTGRHLQIQNKQQTKDSQSRTHNKYASKQSRFEYRMPNTYQRDFSGHGYQVYDNRGWQRSEYNYNRTLHNYGEQDPQQQSYKSMHPRSIHDYRPAVVRNPVYTDYPTSRSEIGYRDGYYVASPRKQDSGIKPHYNQTMYY